ncbi:hypothetical protein [Propioniciclava flava]
MKNVIGPGGVRYPVTPDIERFLRSMDRDALQSLVLEMAGYSPEAMRSLQLRATPEDEPTTSELLAAVDAALAAVDLDYHDPFYEDVDDGVQGVEESVDELERHLDDGINPVVRRVLQHLLTRLGDLARDADNADALLEVAERASTLFGRAVAGHPDPVGLARWVVGFRVEYGGWPSLALDAVAHAFDEPAWDAYRASVTTLGGGGPAADPYRSETDRMLLELADHDGDVERAVALLSGGDRPYYREILRRMRDAGRPADVLAWLDRAVTQGCVDVAWRAGPTVVPVKDAVDAYLDGGRPDAALTIARTLFDRDLSVDAFRLLISVAERCGSEDEQRTWAFEQATLRAHSSGGAHLVRLHLADGNVTCAWEAADAFGACHAWRELVDASEDDFPLRAGRLCLAQVLESLTTPDSKRYPAIVDLLVKARALYDTAGHRAEADAEILRLREAYRRRPALMSAMNQAGLPS